MSRHEIDVFVTKDNFDEKKIKHEHRLFVEISLPIVTFGGEIKKKQYNIMSLCRL